MTCELTEKLQIFDRILVLLVLSVCVLFCRLTDDERKIRLEEQIKSNEYHRFVEGNLILKQGLLDKRKVRLWSVSLRL